jgi:hypothetical protein
MDLGSPESNNLRFGHAQFLNGHAAAQAFGGLITSIRAMASVQGRDVERFLPGINEMGAWPKAYSIYCALKNEQERPASSEAIEDRRNQEAFSRDEILWNSFIQEREQLLAYNLSAVQKRYLGIEEDDLDMPFVRHEKVGACRRPDWKIIASKIAGALSQWRYMSPTERRNIPNEMRVRQLEQVLATLEKETTHG